MLEVCGVLSRSVNGHVHSECNFQRRSYRVGLMAAGQVTVATAAGSPCMPWCTIAMIQDNAHQGRSDGGISVYIPQISLP